MDYHEAANFLFDLRRYPPREGLAATRALLSHLDDPHEGIRFVQVAGSNGKGSTASMTARVLREAGLDVGLYTSPHMDDVRERIRVNGRPVPKRAIREFVEAVRPYVIDRAAEGEAPTFFETLTVFALWEFARQGVDVGVLEVGIGGRFDATSVVDPVASAVTTVALEHTDLLGETVEEIAHDKAHVAPADGPLVTAATGEALDTIRAVADDVIPVGPAGSTDGAGEPDSVGHREGTGGDADVLVRYRGRDRLEGVSDLAGPDWGVEARLSLLGPHQAVNAGVAATLAREVAAVSEPEIARGLRATDWPGRCEITGREPLVLLDGAHNPGGCAAIADVLAEFDYDRLHLVVGALVDKDHRGMAAALPALDRVIACRPNVDRAEDEDAVAAAFGRAGAGTVETRHAVSTAVDRALSEADPADCVLVTGSLYTVAEARTRWSRIEVPKRVRDIDGARETLERAHVTDAGVWRMRGKAVHRVLRTRVQSRQAQFLKEELLSLGGECAVSGIRDADEPVDVVLMGTLAQFKRLTEKLRGQPYGLRTVADDVRATLDIGTGPRGERRGYPWEDGTAVMGVLNVTPDSFHDGGRFDDTGDAVERAREMAAGGADIVDVGGESTRPGADPVRPAVEEDRVRPVIEELAGLDVLVSIDTRKAAVARAAIEAGADMINDVSGLEDPGMRFVAAEHDVPLVVMHSIDAPVVPDKTVEYDDVVEDVIAALGERVRRAEQAGLDRSRIVVDPGLGFGKRSAESFELLGRLGELRALGCPVMVGHSHKSMFDHVDRGPGDRLPPTVAATALAADRGADIVRVHDVAENLAAVRAVEAASDPDGFALEE